MGSGETLCSGSGSFLRLDPFSLPATLVWDDVQADGGIRQIDLDTDRAIIRRTVSGMKMVLNLPVSMFLGVSVRMAPPQFSEHPGQVSLILEHLDEDLSVPLLSVSNCDDVIAYWYAWARVLGVPLLVAETDGTLRRSFDMLGVLYVGKPRPRRRRRGAVASRRPKLLMRRKVGQIT